MKKPNNSTIQALLPAEWLNGRFPSVVQGISTPWTTMGYFLFFIPNNIRTVYQLYRLYRQTSKHLDVVLPNDASFKEHCTNLYMSFFILLQWNLLEHKQIRSQWTQTHECLIETMYAVYMQIIQLDDALDGSETPLAIFNDVFTQFKINIWGSSVYDEQAILPYKTKHSYATILEQAKMAFHYEIMVKEQNLSKLFWQSLRIQAFVLSGFTAQIISTYTKQSIPKVHEIVFGYIMFMGNIADDWMDYLWVKEDRGTRCYIEAAFNEHDDTHTQKYKVWKIVWTMLIQLCVEIGSIQIKLRNNPIYQNLFPSIAVLSIYTGLANLWMFFRLQRK